MSRNVMLAAVSAISIVAAMHPAMAIAGESSNVLVMRRVVMPEKTRGTPGNDGGSQQAATWRTGEWSNVSNGQNCSAQIDQRRTVECVRDGNVIADSNCTAPRPAEIQTIPQNGSCYFNWVAGEWSAPTAACGASQQTRTMTCMNNAGHVVAEEKCAGTPKGATTQATNDYSACSYSWGTIGYGDWDQSCSSSAKRTVQIRCIRQDGAIRPNGECADAGQMPETTQIAANYSGCQYNWKTTAWGPNTPACGTQEQTRTITCERSDGTLAPDSLCTDARPAASQTIQRTDSCTYDWYLGPLSMLTEDSPEVPS